jgi:hypothetical protein
MTIICDEVPAFCPGCGKRFNDINPDDFFAGVSGECWGCGGVLWQYTPVEDLMELASQHGDLEKHFDF